MKRYFRTEAHNKAGVVVKNTFLEVHPFDVWSLDIIFDVKFQCWLSRACQVGDHIPSLHDWCGNLVPVFFFCISWSSQPRRRQLSEPAGNSEPASLMASCIHPVNKGVLHSSCEHWDTFQDWCATDHYTVIANVFSAAFYMTFIWFVDSQGGWCHGNLLLNVSFQVKIYTSVEADEAGCKLLESLISKVAEVDAGSVKQLIIDFCKIIAHNDVSFIKKTIDEKSSHLVEGGVAFCVFFSQGFAVGVEDVNVVSAATEAREQSIGFIWSGCLWKWSGRGQAT